MPPTPIPLEEYHAIALARLSEMIEVGMAMARVAAARVLSPDDAGPAPNPPNKRDPYLEFARATKIVRDAIALQLRILSPRPAAPRSPAPAPIPAPAPAQASTPPDPDRLILRQTLHDAARTEPDRATRTRLCRSIDEALETSYRDHPETPIEDRFTAVCDRFGLHIDYKNVPDRVLGMPRRPGFPDPPLRRR